DTGIAPQLKALPYWISWRPVPNGTRTEKIPTDPVTGQNIDHTNPDNWLEYITAGTTAVEHQVGIGFEFTKTNDLTGIDLDKCRDLHTGEIAPWASAIVRLLNSYTEISVSGTGLHIIVSGTLPKGRRKRGAIEAYDDGRFFAITGNRLPETP